jgi:carboxypeptidase T
MEGIMCLKNLVTLIIGLIVPLNLAFSQKDSRFLLKIKALDSFQRSLIADTGASIEELGDDYVVAIANFEERKSIKRKFEVLGESSLDLDQILLDFPARDEAYHDYYEVEDELSNLVQEFPQDIEKLSIGKSVEGRDIWLLKISKGIKQSNHPKPAVIFMGGHHAREHLSVEVPLGFIKWLMREWTNGNNPRVNQILETREIHFIPMVNPDGLSYDIDGGRYKAWRKNRARNANGTFGVDLNRIYGYKWGTGGSSTNPSSETYMGPKPFSEPETLAIKNYLERNRHIRIVLSFHTFSELILYPWGHTQDPIANKKDQELYEVMAQTMAKWNNYKPMSSSDLYIASGDLTDWSYGELGMISFTFELDPKNTGFGTGGFYPGPSAIEPTIKKNIEPCLYLLEYADDPYRAIAK